MANNSEYGTKTSKFRHLLHFTALFNCWKMLGRCVNRVEKLNMIKTRKKSENKFKRNKFLQSIEKHKTEGFDKVF